ncbi:alanine racemase [Phenylobacterium sp.]|jgi:alanine racemase|uniref:alanine racemase n=1 Tax=Phenylobacterium sp. TaxID=1871053 RepID=UPI002F923FFA
MESSARARLTVDLDALAHNLAVLRDEAASAEVAPVVKSDGYGLGAAPLARRLRAEGARSFFVARLEEGEALRRALGPQRDATIYVLDGVTAGAGPRLAASGLTPVICALPQVAAASAFARQSGRPWPVALHVDTGMNRQGLTLDDARALAQSSDGLDGLDVTLLMSHLGSATEPADPRNSAQLAAFRAAASLFPHARQSLAASAGAFLGADYRFDMVRPGVSLYGGGPEERPDPRLRAVATLTAPILDVRTYRPGDRIGYGARVTVDRPVRAAILAAGYSDGVLRAGMGGGYAWFAGQRRPILIVTMDLIAVEIGDAPARIGEHVELLGPNALLDDQAAAAGTVAHEVLVRLSTRAERVYLGEA